MNVIFLILDLLCPLFFFFLGRRMKGSLGKSVRRESLAVLAVAVLFSPVAAAFYSSAVQGFLCAFIFFCQFLLLYCQSVRYHKKAACLNERAR